MDFLAKIEGHIRSRSVLLRCHEKHDVVVPKYLAEQPGRSKSKSAQGSHINPKPLQDLGYRFPDIETHIVDL